MDGAIITGKLPSHSPVWRLMLANKWALSRGCQWGHLCRGVPCSSWTFSEQDVGFQERACQESQAEAALPFLIQRHMLLLPPESQALPDGRGNTAPIHQWEECQSPTVRRALGWEISLWPTLETTVCHTDCQGDGSSPKFSN